MTSVATTPIARPPMLAMTVHKAPRAALWARDIDAASSRARLVPATQYNDENEACGADTGAGRLQPGLWPRRDKSRRAHRVRDDSLRCADARRAVCPRWQRRARRPAEPRWPRALVRVPRLDVGDLSRDAVESRRGIWRPDPRAVRANQSERSGSERQRAAVDVHRPE